MAANKSVQLFRKLTDDLKAEVHAGAVAELNSVADDLVGTMERVVPRGATGELQISIRKVPDRSKDTVVRIVGGNTQTTRSPGHSGPVRSALHSVGLGADTRPYNYARAVEFGTVHMRAEPFFFPTYRLLKKKMISRMKSKIRAAIKKRSA